jgi:hypothetical protein
MGGLCETLGNICIVFLCQFSSNYNQTMEPLNILEYAYIINWFITNAQFVFVAVITTNRFTSVLMPIRHKNVFMFLFLNDFQQHFSFGQIETRALYAASCIC